MGKIALGILTSILIIALSLSFGVLLLEKVRRELEWRAPAMAVILRDTLRAHL
jgi:hypothetical protein